MHNVGCMPVFHLMITSGLVSIVFATSFDMPFSACTATIVVVDCITHDFTFFLYPLVRLGGEFDSHIDTSMKC